MCFTPKQYLNYSKRILMAKPNYTFEKRQKELAKKKKKEEKRLKKLDHGSAETDPEQPPLTEGQDTPIDSDT
jgi:hypothetical protein